MRIRHVLTLATILCAAAATTLPGQQAPNSVRVAPVSPARARAVSTIPLGPRLSPRFQTVGPRFAVTQSSPLQAQVTGGKQVIVVSTLALVLAALLVVVLVS